MSIQDFTSNHTEGRLPFAPEGWPFVCLLLAVMAVCAGLSCTYGVIIAGLLLAFVVNFFRDPARDTPQDEHAFIAPADGRVIRAEQTDAGTRVDIFMNVFNVHVNRAPMSGRIRHMQYIPGAFVNASFDTASKTNERNRFEMETDDDIRIAFTQIAGLVARRIVTYVSVGDRVRAGMRIGMIRFGSRVNCEMPADFQLQVSEGQTVRAGETILGIINKAHE